MKIGFSLEGRRSLSGRQRPVPVPRGHVTGVQSFDKYRKTGEHILPLLFSTAIDSIFRHTK